MVTAVVMIAGHPVHAQDAAVLAGIDRGMEHYRLDAHIPGMVWGIVKDGRLVHVKGAGVQDVESKRPVTADTLFRIASMTKAFTALSILKLRDDGKLALDAPAETYVPELRGWRPPTEDSPKIRVRELLTHTAGLVTDDPWGDRQTPLPEEDFTRLLREGVPFTRPTATAMEYSNLGYALLGRIVANVSGQPYKDFVQRTLLTPLGMTSTGYDVSAAPAERRALGYRWEDHGWKLEPTMAHGAFGAMGGIQTSANDYAKWVAYLLSAWPARDGADNGPVRRSSVRELAQGANYLSVRPRPGASGAVGVPHRRRLRDGDGRRGRLRARAHARATAAATPGTARSCCSSRSSASASSRSSNRTYAGPRPPVWDAAVALHQAGELTPRPAVVSPALATAYAAVIRMFESSSRHRVVRRPGDELPDGSRRRALGARPGRAQVGGRDVRDGGADHRHRRAVGRVHLARAPRAAFVGSVLLAPTPTPQIQALSLVRAAP